MKIVVCDLCGSQVYQIKTRVGNPTAVATRTAIVQFLSPSNGNPLDICIDCARAGFASGLTNG